MKTEMKKKTGRARSEESEVKRKENGSNEVVEMEKPGECEVFIREIDSLVEVERGNSKLATVANNEDLKEPKEIGVGKRSISRGIIRH